MTLEVEEFLRRFLLHVLPPQFKRIRHYGLLSCQGRRERLARCRKLLEEAICVEAEAEQEAAKPAAPWRQCPVCGERLQIRLWVWPKGCGPPLQGQQRGENAWVWQAA